MIVLLCILNSYVGGGVGICVQDRVQVSVSLPVNVNMPLPYQLVRGEQLVLLGSVYNEDIEPIQVMTRS